MSKKSLLTEESPFIVIIPSSIISLQRLKVTKSQQLVSLIKGSAKTLESLKIRYRIEEFFAIFVILSSAAFLYIA